MKWKSRAFILFQARRLLLFHHSKCKKDLESRGKDRGQGEWLESKEKGGIPTFTSAVRPLEGAIFVWAQLTPLWRDRRKMRVDSEVGVDGCVMLCVGILTTRAARSCDSHFRQNHGPVGTWTMP